MILAAVLGLYCVAVLGYFGWTYINDNPDDDGIVGNTGYKRFLKW